VAEIEQVIRVYQQDDRNFLLPPPPQRLTAESYLDISHEALLRQWRLFAGEWQEQERRDASELRRLAELASLRKQNQEVGLLPARDLDRIGRWKQRVSPEWARRYVTQNEWVDTLAFVEDSQAEVKREEEVRRNEARRKRVWVQAVALVLTVATLVSLVAAIFSYWQMTQAERAQNEAKEQLFGALLSSARAGRFSGQLGQRFDSLEALSKAARMHFHSDEQLRERLRNEATVAMALPDFRPGPSWHHDEVVAVDESYKLSAKIDGDVITVHSVPDGREVGRIESHQPEALFFSQDGSLLAQSTRSSDGTKMWTVWRWADAHSVLGEPVRGEWCIAFSPDNHHIAIAQGNSILRFDLDTGKEVNHWGVRGRVNALAFNPDSRKIAVGYDNPNLNPEVTSIYDAATGELCAELQVGSVTSQVLAWHPDGIRLAIGSTDPRIQIWNVITKQKVASLEGHVQQVTNLSFHPDGQLLASCGWEGVCRFWNPSTGRQVMQSSSFTPPFFFSRDGQWFGAIGTGDEGKRLEAASPSEYRTIVSSLGAGKDYYLDGAVSPDGRLVAFATVNPEQSADDGVRVWDLSSWRELAFLPIGTTYCVLFQPDGRELITCGAGTGRLLRWPIQRSADSPDQMRLGPSKVIPLPFWIERASRSQDGRTLAAVGKPGAIVVDLSTGGASELLPHEYACYVALSPDGQWMATSGWHSDRVRLWKAPNGITDKEWRLAYESVPGQMTRVAFSPDSRTLITGRADEFAFWDVASRVPAQRIPSEPGGALRDVAFSPDGKLMALALSPSIVQLRETASGRIVARLEDPHGDRITWMGFNADGTRLLTCSAFAKAIHDWDLRAIRARLKSMGLDWDWPEFPPSSELRPFPANPVRSIEVISDQIPKGDH
jgi:WD40 repeat protein